MFTLKIQPENGQMYELTHNYGEFKITRVDGLGPVMNAINMTQGSGDGGIFNSARLETRNIVITCVLYGDIAASRHKLYRIFPQKSPVTVFFSAQGRNMKTIGYVERPACDPFTLRETAQISIICPDSYWTGMDEISATLLPNRPVTLDNVGDAPAGFLCTLNFSSGSQPAVTLGETTATLTAVYPYQKSLMLNPINGGVPVADDFDPETQKITELMLGGVDYTNSISSVEKIVHQYDISGTGATLIHVEMAQNVFGTGTYSVSYVVASVDGGSMETVEYSYYVSASMSASVTMANCNINFRNVLYDDNFFKDKDFYKVLLKNTAGTWTEVTEQCTLLGEASILPFVYAHFDYDLYNAGYREGKLVIYHDTNGADLRSTLDLHQYSGTRTPSTDWYANMYSTIPAGFNAAKDIPYINGIRIPASDISYQYIVSGGTTTEYPVIYGDPSASVEFRYVYSLSGADIRTYSTDQIDAGLTGTYYTRGVVLWNHTTGSWMNFKNTRFQLGDVAKISTVPGDLYAKIVQRDGQNTDISLLNDVYKNGYFFTLAQGENEIELTAQSGGSYVSGEISAGVLYIGV